MSRHPHLSRKFSLLFSLRLNPAINSYADLSKRLNISRQAVSKWIKGTETRAGDAIPPSQLDAVASLFEINANWFANGYDDFELKLRRKVAMERSGNSSRPESISLSLLPITRLQLTGRKSERELLDQAWLDPGTNVIQITAFGGVGKSALINSWLSLMSRDDYRGACKVYGWSFYWQGASGEVNSSGDYFIEHALTWFGDDNPTKGTPWDKAVRLANLVRNARTLLILDGLEPLQYPPGPNAGQIENPAVALLVRELAAHNNGLCVITSRLDVTDLDAFRDTRVTTLVLENLPLAAGVEMLESTGIHGEKHNFESAVIAYSGHPLSLHLLAGYLRVVHQGNINDFREIRSLLDEQSSSIHARNIMSCYLDWFRNSPERSILFVVALFDRGIALEEMQNMVAGHEISGLTTELHNLLSTQWRFALARLKSANLIAITGSGQTGVIDCHPLVRDFITDYLARESPEIWHAGHRMIFDYLQSQAVESPVTMAQLEPLFRAVIHGAQAGLYDDAFEVYFKRIKKEQFSMFTEGSHYADQTCIQAFFNVRWTQPVEQLPEAARFYLLSCASANLIYLGKIDDAIGPATISIRWFQQNGMWLEALNTAAPLASMLIAAGKLDAVFSLIDNMHDCIEKSNNSVAQAMAWSFKAYALHLSGRDSEAAELFEMAENVLVRTRPQSHVSFPTISSYYCKYLLNTGAVDQALQRSLKTFAWRKKGAWQVAVDTTSILASDIQVLGLIFLSKGDWINARIYLDRQVELFKSANEWLYLPTGLNARAALYIKRRDFKAAIADLEESVRISKNTGAKFGLWEAYLLFAQLYFEQKDFEASTACLEQSRLLVEMDRYRFRDWEIKELENNLWMISADNLNPEADKPPEQC